MGPFGSRGAYNSKSRCHYTRNIPYLMWVRLPTGTAVLIVLPLSCASPLEAIQTLLRSLPVQASSYSLGLIEPVNLMKWAVSKVASCVHGDFADRLHPSAASFMLELCAVLRAAYCHICYYYYVVNLKYSDADDSSPGKPFDSNRKRPGRVQIDREAPSRCCAARRREVRFHVARIR